MNSNKIQARIRETQCVIAEAERYLSKLRVSNNDQ